MEGEKAVVNSTEKSSLSELFLLGAVKFLARSYLFLSSLSSDPNPIFSIVISFYCLILLYLPHLFLSFVFSPVLISTAVLLGTLFRLGSTKHEKEEIFQTAIEEQIWVQPKTDLGLAVQQKDAIFTPEIEEAGTKEAVMNRVDGEKGFVRNPDLSEMFPEWNRNGPLEVIYEEYEGEEDEDSPEKDRRYMGVNGFLSSSFDYSDSDSSEGESPERFPPAWDSPENLCFLWEEKEGLIEIPLGLKPTVGFELEEENLIEINLFSVGK